jgi:hemerythrin-like domain-containing protein
MDAISLLTNEHKVVKEILNKLISNDSEEKERDRLFVTLTENLNNHEIIEEKVFYPSLKDHEETRELILEAIEEHHVADKIVAEMEKLKETGEKWMAKLTVLKENLEHHIQEEEQELFPKAKRILNQDTLDKLGDEMEQLNAEAKK